MHNPFAIFFFFSRFHPKVAHPGCAWIAAHSGSALCSVVPSDVTGVFLRNTTVLKTQYVACLQTTVMYPSSIFLVNGGKYIALA